MRIEQLTFTRFLAATSIVVFHYGQEVYPFSSDALKFLFEQADVCVSYFFLLSGFVMMVAYNGASKIDPLGFYVKRISALYPAMFLALALIVLYLGWNQISGVELLLNLLVVQAWMPGKSLSLNFPAWSLSVEFFFYAFFPFLFNSIYQRKNYFWLFMLGFLIWIATQLILNWHMPEDYRTSLSTEKFEFLFYFPFMHLNEFLLGNVTGFYFMNELKHKKANYDVYLLILVTFMILAFKYPFGLIYDDGMLAIFFIPFIVFLSLNTGFITFVFKSRICVLLGEISFGIYIYQYPVFAWVSEERLVKYLNVSTGQIFPLQFVTLITVALSSHFFVERPIRKLMRVRT